MILLAVIDIIVDLDLDPRTCLNVLRFMCHPHLVKIQVKNRIHNQNYVIRGL